MSSRGSCFLTDQLPGPSVITVPFLWDMTLDGEGSWRGEGGNVGVQKKNSLVKMEVC